MAPAAADEDTHTQFKTLKFNQNSITSLQYNNILSGIVYLSESWKQLFQNLNNIILR